LRLRFSRHRATLADFFIFPSGSDSEPTRGGSFSWTTRPPCELGFPRSSRCFSFNGSFPLRSSKPAEVATKIKLTRLLFPSFSTEPNSWVSETPLESTRLREFPSTEISTSLSPNSPQVESPSKSQPARLSPSLELLLPSLYPSSQPHRRAFAPNSRRLPSPRRPQRFLLPREAPPQLLSRSQRPMALPSHLDSVERPLR